MFGQMAKDPSSKYLDQLIENELYYILDTGGDVNGINYSGRQHTLLHRACKENSFKGVQLLLGSGADVNKLTASGTSVLCIAAFFADNDTVEIGTDKQFSAGLLLIDGTNDTRNRIRHVSIEFTSLCLIVDFI